MYGAIGCARSSNGQPMFLSLLSFCLGSLQILLYPELHDPADQVEGDWLVQGKPYRALRAFIDRQLILERLHSSGRGVKPDMLLESGKMNRVTLQRKGGHSVFD